MKTIQSVRTIHAPLPDVFDTVSNIQKFSSAVPQITKTEFLTDQKSGVGTRFRETRSTNGREQCIELEVTEWIEDESVRMVSDAGRAIWDTLFTVKQLDNDVELTMKMEVTPHNLLARLFNSMIRSLVVKGVEADMDAVKLYCE